MGPVRGHLLSEMQLRLDGPRHSRLLVLGTGRHRKSILPLLVCLMEVVELRKDEGARTGATQRVYVVRLFFVSARTNKRQHHHPGRPRAAVEVAPRRLPQRCRPHLMAVRVCEGKRRSKWWVVARQTNLLNRVVESAQEDEKQDIGRVC